MAHRPVCTLGALTAVMVSAPIVFGQSVSAQVEPPQWEGVTPVAGVPEVSAAGEFTGSMMVGRVERTGHIERVVLNANGEEIRRESILGELWQRIRDIRQGPDGLIYVLTDEDEGGLLRIEPAGAGGPH